MFDVTFLMHFFFILHLANEERNLKEEMKEKRKKLEALDSLRGIAVLMVIGYHLYPEFVKGGFLGVSLFFVLSGFLITLTSEASWTRSTFTITDFYSKRIRRIYPVLVVLFVANVCIFTFVDKQLLGGIRSEGISFFLGYNNWWQIMHNVSYFQTNGLSSPFKHLWSLSIEVQFYCLWPIFFLGYKKILGERFLFNRIVWIGIGISAALLFMLYQPGEDPSRVYYGTDTRIFSILLGCLMGENYQLYTGGFSKESKEEKYLQGALLFLGLVAFFFTNENSPWTYRIGLFLTSILFAVVILFAVDVKSFTYRVLNQSFLKWIGKRSYGVYMYHFPILILWKAFFGMKITVLEAVPLVCLILVSAAYSYKYMEKPILTQEKWYGNRKEVFFDEIQK